MHTDPLLQTEDGDHCEVSLKYPHYYPIMKHAKTPESRRKMNVAFLSRWLLYLECMCMIQAQLVCLRCRDENTDILQELVKLRRKVRF